MKIWNCFSSDSHLWEEVVRREVGEVGGEWVARLGQASSHLLLEITITTVSIIRIPPQLLP